jgi:hypothetical protein
MVNLNAEADQRHHELLQLSSDSQYSDTASVVSSIADSEFSSANGARERWKAFPDRAAGEVHLGGRRHWLTSIYSSAALSLLPAPPQIFHGRDSELNEIVGALMRERARVAIIGSGGMGKTTLGLAALHHLEVEKQYPQRHFVSCESATSSEELISILGLYLQIPRSTGMSREIYGHFLEGGPAILMLDNMETPWEPLATRTQVEEFLSLLADVPQLALLVTIHVLYLGATKIFDRLQCAARSGLAK